MSRLASQQESEDLQLLLLQTLEKADIPDTRVLKLQNGQDVGPQPEEQAAIKAALDSLAAKEVSIDPWLCFMCS